MSMPLRTETYFSYFFKKYKLGPLIGMRTWGGVRGIRGEIPLMDGGYVTRPEFSLYGLNSDWLIENRGVAPDIEVDNTPRPGYERPRPATRKGHRGGDERNPGTPQETASAAR